MELLSLPLLPDAGHFPRTALDRSIVYSIGLILTSRLGMMPFLPDYGCDLWEREFTDLPTANKANIRASLRNSIDTHERRLYNVSVSFSEAQTSSGNALGLLVRVTGNYRDGAEEKKLQADFHVG